MKKLLCFFAVCFLFTLPAFLFAQTAVEIEEILDADVMSYGKAVSFILRAADVSDTAGNLDFNDSKAAFEFAANRKWLPGAVASGDSLNLEGLSLLLMKSFGLKGGMFYSLSQSPHYAYRELLYKDIIQGRVDPEMTVSGDLFLFLVSRMVSMQEGED